MQKYVRLKTVAALQAYSAVNNQEIYCEEYRTRYRFSVSGEAYYVNGRSVLSSTTGPNARWIGVSGKNTYIPELDPGVLRPGDLYQQNRNLATLSLLSTYVGASDEIVFCEETKTGYRYVLNGGAIPVNGFSVLATATGGDTRWIGVEGPQTYVNLINRRADGKYLGHDLDGNFSSTGNGVGNLEIQNQSTTVIVGPLTLNFQGPGVTTQETIPGSGVIDIFIGAPAPPPSFNINGFSVSPNLLELGQDLVNPTFNYTTSPTPATTLTIDNGVGAATIPAGPFTPTITFPSPGSPGSLSFLLSGTLTGYPNASASTSVTWRSKMYWGAVLDQSIVNLTTLNYTDLINTYGVNPSDSEPRTNRNITKAFDASGGRYIMFLYPTSFGIANPHLQVGPFPVSLPGANVNTNITFTNQYGAVSTYTMLITNIQFGSNLTVAVL